jgi:glycosyltransferase involved in cell wall biosynthesis
MPVSVIIPTYNRKKFLKEAIHSVLSQSFKELEIIVVDDGSSYKSEWVETLDPRLHYIYCAQRGVVAARNFGVSISSGEYIAFLDSDDLWEKKKLEKQLSFLKAINEEPRISFSGSETKYKICYTDEKWVRKGEHLNQMKKHQKYHGHIFEKCLPLCIISASSILMEREVFYDLGGFDESFPVCEDYDLWLRMSLRYPIAYLDDKLIVKRGGHSDQLSKKYWGMDRFRIRALEKLLGMRISPDQERLVMDELKKKCEVLVTGSWKRRKYFRWLRYKLKSIMLMK